MEVSEHDWKIFTAKIAQWQEDYMGKLCLEYIHLLSADKAPSEKFWALEKRVFKDRKTPGVCVIMSRSKMISNIEGLLHDHVITQEDLSEFSQELRDHIEHLRVLEGGSF